jgi:hypothetical protein
MAGLSGSIFTFGSVGFGSGDSNVLIDALEST